MRILIVTLLGLGLAGCQKTDTATPADATPRIATAPSTASELAADPPYLDDDERAARRPAQPAAYEEEVSDEDDYDDEDYADEADVSYDDYEDEDPDESYESSDPY